jgi:tyrosyl-tRNA synthetase
MPQGSPEEQLEVFRAGTEGLVSEADLLVKLRKGRPLRVKLGCDPSAPDLHLGHVVQLDKLRALQDLGHQIVFLIGDFTAMIGDPSGRSRTRPVLNRQQVERNAATYCDQVGHVLDMDRVELRFNSEWMDRLAPADFVRLASRYTLARMLEREDFKQRYREGTSIAIHELLYPLVQAYDSVALEADVELGGSDQLFNLLVAREIQRDYGQPAQIALTMPLLEGLDGAQKMSKSVGNAIGIAEPPEEIYGKTMSIPDALLDRWCALLARPDWAEVLELRLGVARGEANPRDLKAALARRLVDRFHGEAAARGAEQHFDRVFRQGLAPQELPEFAFPAGGGPGPALIDVLTGVRFAASRGEARRLLAQGAVRLNEERVADPELRLERGRHLLQVGKRRFARVSVADPQP